LQRRAVVVAFGIEADIKSSAEFDDSVENDPKLTSGSSFNYLIGDGKHCRRHLDAERSCRLQIDEKLELGRLQHRQIGGPRALEYAAGIDADLMKCLRRAFSIPFAPRNRRVWGWDCRSAGRSSKLTADACGPPLVSHTGLSFSLRSLLGGLDQRRMDCLWPFSNMASVTSDVRSQRDCVAKVENRTTPKISRKSNYRRFRRYNTPWRRYEAPSPFF
jgi:hypothetical protein